MNDEERIREVKDSAALTWNIRPDSLTDNYRGERWVWARAFAVYYLRFSLGLTWHKIGATLKRDYSTCIHLARKVGDALRRDRQIETMYYGQFMELLEYETDKGTTGSARTLRATL